MKPIRIASWNHRRTRHPGQLALLRRLQLDLLLLQDVSPGSYERLSPLIDQGDFAWARHSLAIRPPKAGEGGSRAKGTAIIGTQRLKPVNDPFLLPDVPAPERTIALNVDCEGVALTAASINLVAGDPRDRNWGPSAKAAFFRSLATWLSQHKERTLVGVDCNSPRIDHPDVAKNEYWHFAVPDDQDEHLLLDPSRSPHNLRDVFREYLKQHPAELAQLVSQRPNGPLAVSHMNVSSITSERRYDYIFATPDLEPRLVRYLANEVGLGEKNAISDHAIVLAEIAIHEG